MMSDQVPSKKVVHKLEPKERPVMSTSIDDADKLEGLSQIAPSVNTQFFGEGPQCAVDVETGWDGVKVKSVGQKLLIVSVFAVSSFLVVFMVWGLFLTKETAKREVEVVETTLEKQLSYEEKSASRQEAIRNYLGATSIDEKVKYVRDPERVRPLMEKYYTENPLEAETLAEALTEEPIMGKEGVMWRVKARHAIPGQSTYLILETSESGVSLIDWETNVIYQPSDWDKFIATRSTRPHTFRVFLQGAQLAGFHGYEFADYLKYRCFKLTIPGREDYLWAYTKIGSPVDLKLMSLITYGGRRNIHTDKKVRGMVRLRFPQNSQSAICVSIEDLLQAGWFH